MTRTPFALLRSRRLLPLFIAQFFGAANDNLFKNALVILITYHATVSATLAPIIVTLSGAIFILPYFLFSATAGQVADRLEKASLIRGLKLWEIVIMLLAALSFALDSLTLELTVLFLLGVQAAAFGPVKYGILPDHLRPDELLGGNALLETGTFLAILIGTIAGGLMMLAPHGPTIASATLLILAIAGWIASRAIPPAGPAAPDLRIGANIIGETWAILRYAATHRTLFLAMLGISWFWLVGATFLAQFPNFCKATLNADEEVVTLFLTLFSIGIGIGTLLCNRVLRGVIDARYVPWGALGITVFSLDLYLATSGAGTAAAGPLVGAAGFLARPANWRIVFDLVATAASGGFYIVPLYAILQSRSEQSHRSRVIAANNILNALFMVASGIGGAALLAVGLTVPEIFLAMALVNAGAALAMRRLITTAEVER